MSRALAIAEGALAMLRAGAHSRFRMADFFQVTALGNVSAYALVIGDLEKAAIAARAAVVQAHRAGFPRATAIQLQHLATAAALRGETRIAARLGGFVDETFRIDRTPRQPTEQRTYQV